MPTVTCECGQKINVREDKLGEQGKCPACKQPLNLEFWNCLGCNARNPEEAISCYRCETSSVGSKLKPKPLYEIMPSNTFRLRSPAPVPPVPPVPPEIETPVSYPTEKDLQKTIQTSPNNTWSDPVRESAILIFASATANILGILSAFGILVGGVMFVLTLGIELQDGSDDTEFFTKMQTALFIASSVSSLLFSAITLAVFEALRTISKIEHKLK